MKATERFDSHRDLSTSDNLETEGDKMEEIATQLVEMMRAITSLQNQYTALSASTSSSNAGNNRAFDDYFRIPDPIKSLPTFEGNRKQLASWLSTADNTLALFKDLVPAAVYQMYVTAVTNKICGKAKDILCLSGSPQNFDEIKEILISSLGDRQELSTYKCQMWQNKMTDGMSIHKYYHQTKEIVQNIKTLAKQNEQYRTNWVAINAFIDEDALAAFIAGLRGNYFGHAQAARPKDIEDAYAFLCKFKATEQNAGSLTKNVQTPSNKPPFKNKFNQNESTSYNKPTKAISEKKFSIKNSDKPEPMDVDASMRSKYAQNKKQFHNNEVETEQESNDSDSDDETDHFNEVNFRLAGSLKNNT